MKTLYDYEVFVFLILFVLVLLTLTGCGSGLSPAQRTPDDFRPYTEAFDAEAAARGLNLHATDTLSISFADLAYSEGVGEVGVCHYGIDNPLVGRSIQIDINAWPTLSEGEKTTLIFHELGHCLLNRQHTSKLIPGTSDAGLVPIPASIMNPSIIPDDAFEANYPYYINELFGHPGT